MSREDKILNFCWHLPGQLATGGKPSRKEQVDWLITQGFRAILSLEVIPDSTFGHIQKAGINYAYIDADDDSSGEITRNDPKKWEQFSFFVSANIEEGYPVFAHCSAGNKRSPYLAKEYLESRLCFGGWRLPGIKMYKHSPTEVQATIGNLSYVFDTVSGMFFRQEEETKRKKRSDLLLEIEKPCRLVFSPNGGPFLQIDFEQWRPYCQIGRLVLLIREPERSLEEKVNDITERACDLNSRHEDCLRGHIAFAGKGVQAAVSILLSAFDVGQSDIIIKATATFAFIELFYHIEHRCYGLKARTALHEAGSRLGEIAEREQHPDLQRLIQNAVTVFERMKQYLG